MNRLIDVEFYGNADYEEHTYEVENVVDIFSSVAGYLSVLYTVMSIVISSHVKEHMTKIILETIYTNAGKPRGPEYHGPHEFEDGQGVPRGYGKGSQAHHGRPGKHPPPKDARYIHSRRITGHQGNG